jgi:hypothetical protein
MTTQMPLRRISLGNHDADLIAAGRMGLHSDHLTALPVPEEIVPSIGLRMFRPHALVQIQAVGK